MNEKREMMLGKFSSDHLSTHALTSQAVQEFTYPAPTFVRNNFTVMGQACRFLAQQPITVAILKDTNMHAIKENYRFGVLFDGSEVSSNALRKTMSIMADVDRLSVISVIQGHHDESAMSAKIDELCGQQAHETVLLHPEPNDTIRECIKRYLKGQAETDQYIDFVCIGNRGPTYRASVQG